MQVIQYSGRWIISRIVEIQNHYALAARKYSSCSKLHGACKNVVYKKTKNTFHNTHTFISTKEIENCKPNIVSKQQHIMIIWTCVSVSNPIYLYTYTMQTLSVTVPTVCIVLSRNVIVQYIFE